MNRKHKFYYHIQAQLNITKRQFCYFVVQSCNDQPQHIEKIEIDKSFWSNVMLPKLKNFYMNCMLPEIIDSRIKRGKPIRNELPS